MGSQFGLFASSLALAVRVCGGCRSARSLVPLGSATKRATPTPNRTGKKANETAAQPKKQHRTRTGVKGKRNHRECFLRGHIVRGVKFGLLRRLWICLFRVFGGFVIPFSGWCGCWGSSLVFCVAFGFGCSASAVVVGPPARWFPGDQQQKGQNQHQTGPAKRDSETTAHTKPTPNANRRKGETKPPRKTNSRVNTIERSLLGHAAWAAVWSLAPPSALGVPRFRWFRFPLSRLSSVLVFLPRGGGLGFLKIYSEMPSFNKYIKLKCFNSIIYLN